ncbi:MAG: alpha/beta fold hydrolase, partial [Nitrososphaerales archaeon]
MPFLNLGERRKMYFKSQGKGSPLVFIHGAYGSHNLWNHQVSFFSPRYNVITMDLRGHGSSFKPRSGYELDKMVDEVMMLLDHLKIENAV